MASNLMRLAAVLGCAIAITPLNATEPNAGSPELPAFANVVPNRAFQFPADHGAHPEFRNEWWYVTGWLDAGDGQPLGFQVTRQLCHAPSTPIGWVSNAVPSGFAWTVVPDGHSPLPYHSIRSTSPLRPGSSLDNHHAGHMPGPRQLSFMRASQVVPMAPRQVPLTKPPK